MGTTLQPELERALEDLLNRETSELAQFIGVLEEELDALAAGHADTIQDCASRKQGMLGRILATRDAVNAVAVRASANPNLKSAEAWLARALTVARAAHVTAFTSHAAPPAV